MLQRMNPSLSLYHSRYAVDLLMISLLCRTMKLRSERFLDAQVQEFDPGTLTQTGEFIVDYSPKNLRSVNMKDHSSSHHSKVVDVC